uniref:pentatricopeptide repeat-containing protein At4g17616 n=1 Tax=Erigeron canadensis TaxID=72917 RepID=UPI001CB96088|nr:pentatricopeptide repeat-containing protein At4g17616 [Erigeron canadensis]XP_043627372.1 pentatricopeptide repeat-containing protein At4g17616 [Erigeron canadensis]
MAWSLMRTTAFDVRFIRSSSSLVYLARFYIQPDMVPFCAKEIAVYDYSRVFLVGVISQKPLNFRLRYLSNIVAPRSLCWEGSSHDILVKNLESYLKNHQVDEAWEVYTGFRKLYGFPDDHLLSMVITELSYTREPKSLKRAYDIILSLPKKKTNSLHFDVLYNLSLSLARAQMSVPASMILRIMIEKDNIPPTNLLGPLMLHLVKKEIGAYLASNILIQICDHFQHSGSNQSTIKPDTTVFNLVLDACSNHTLSLKAQQLIELMAQIGVVGDAYTINTIARIHAINCQRDDLKKFRDCVDPVAGYLSHHYFQFYDCLMSLHFKFNDIDSASNLIFDMINFSETRKVPHMPSLVSLGSRNLRKGLKLQVLPHLLHGNSLVKLERNEGLVMHKNRKLVFTNKTLAKLIVGYKRKGRIPELVKLLCQIQMNNISIDIINACIHVGWLETAHDILDDFEREGELLNAESYTSLLMAYYKGNKHREAEALLKQIKNAGIITFDTTSIPKDVLVSSDRSDLITCLVQEMKEGDTDSSVYEFNSSIYFFMKAGMIDDALKTYKSMQRMKVYPSVATYIYMVMGYSSLEMYREITILWGDIRSSDEGNLSFNRDLYEVLILNFLKGGYFERVMEVIGCMKKHGMYPDKGFYRSEFLKLHKNLYIKLKSSNARTEAQSKRLEHVKAFRKWAGID